ncbi:TetR family transcriptional regulator C-terminal domain-containing protein [Nonomuraea sp. NPDC049152]|uniref:TetR/AcrR family transcriptional regulator n=1 Tax=Nonomuraea sp. NPDC049152 TaxID=3154350 RepID=UPI0033C92109
MPKIVDPESRREEVVEALFRVVRREGLEHASLRNVAEEAGLAIGSVRHYFAGHTELMVFAMQAMAERVMGRLLEHVEKLTTADDRFPVAEAMLAELLPVDERRREEATIWLAFATAARTRPELRPHAEESYDGMRRLVFRVLDGARRLDRLHEDADLEVETERLCALIDGLTVHAVLHPDRVDADLMTGVLRRHLQSLTR